MWLQQNGASAWLRWQKCWFCRWGVHRNRNSFAIRICADSLSRQFKILCDVQAAPCSLLPSALFMIRRCRFSFPRICSACCYDVRSLCRERLRLMYEEIEFLENSKMMFSRLHNYFVVLLFVNEFFSFSSLTVWLISFPTALAMPAEIKDFYFQFLAVCGSFSDEEEREREESEKNVPSGKFCEEKICSSTNNSFRLHHWGPCNVIT